MLGFCVPGFGVLRFCVLLLMAVTGGAAQACADVNLLLEGPIKFIGGLTSTGHAVVWLDSVCSDDAVHVRACRAGEAGIVVSRYSGAAGYDWLAMPVVPYLFGTEEATPMPEAASQRSFDAVREAYRKAHPEAIPAALPAGMWEQVLGESYRRTILVVHLKTTPAEEARLLAWLQSRKNRSHFNLFWNNCADFSRQVLDVAFPGSVHRSFVYDAGIMTPEQVASSVMRYAQRHPGLDARVSVLPQVPGTIKRSGRIYGTTESFVKTKPYLLPLTVLNPIEFGALIAVGLTDRRFDVQEQVKTAPVLDLSALDGGGPPLAGALPPLASRGQSSTN